MQEELERTYLHKQQLEQQAHQVLETTKNEKDQTLKRLKTSSKRLKDELKQAKVELINKSRELEKYHLQETTREKSLAWKITTPMRAIAKPFKKTSRDKESIQEQIDLLRTCGLFDEGVVHLLQMKMLPKKDPTRLNIISVLAPLKGGIHRRYSALGFILKIILTLPKQV